LLIHFFYGHCWHYFNFRRFKTVYFTNVKFLKEVKEETASRSKLKHWLVLLSRLLALAFLVLAFAQPFLPKEDADVVTGNKSVSVFVDNSFSMNAQSEDVSLFEKAKQKAQEVVEAFGPEDKFQLITHDLEGKHQRLLTKDAFLAELEQLKITPNVSSLSNVLAPVQLLNQTNKLIVRLKNTGTAAVENTRLELNINDEVKAINNISIAAQSEKIDTLNFRVGASGWHKAKVSIADYPINFDDTYFFTFFIPEQIEVLSINNASTNKYIDALFKDQSQIKLTNQLAGKVEYASIPSYQLVVVNGLKSIASGLAYELQQYVAGGGSVVVFPNENIDIDNYKQFTQALKLNNYESINYNERQVNKLNTKQEIFNDVFENLARNIDLPTVKKSYDLTRFTATNEEVLLRLNDQKSFLSKYNFGSGKAYLSAVPLNREFSNLASHAIFVPMMLKMVLAGAQNNSIAYTIGEANNIEVANNRKNQDEVLKLKNENKEFIPGQKAFGSKVNLAVNNQMQEAGIYEMLTDTEQNLSFFGFNFNRKESLLEHFSLSELKEKFLGDKVYIIENFKEDITQIVGEIDKGVVLWKICLILVLVFLAIEVLFLRFLPG